MEFVHVKCLVDEMEVQELLVAMSSSTLGSAETDEVDPIRASYDIFIKPQMSAKRQIYVLQFPNSTKHYSKSTECEPLAMRVKAAAGMVELDVPMDIYRNYDREKAVRWGEAMRKADGKSGASHGLPGGFGLGGNAGKGRPKAEERDQDIITLAEHYESSVRDGRVLMKQTLGGQVVPKGATVPQYMVGAFRKGTSWLRKWRGSCN